MTVVHIGVGFLGIVCLFNILHRCSTKPQFLRLNQRELLPELYRYGISWSSNLKPQNHINIKLNTFGKTDGQNITHWMILAVFTLLALHVSTLDVIKYTRTYYNQRCWLHVVRHDKSPTVNLWLWSIYVVLTQSSRFQTDQYV